VRRGAAVFQAVLSPRTPVGTWLWQGQPLRERNKGIFNYLGDSAAYSIVRDALVRWDIFVPEQAVT
jgi:hypothetical protein